MSPSMEEEPSNYGLGGGCCNIYQRGDISCLLGGGESRRRAHSKSAITICLEGGEVYADNPLSNLPPPLTYRGGGASVAEAAIRRLLGRRRRREGGKWPRLLQRRLAIAGSSRYGGGLECHGGPLCLLGNFLYGRENLHG